MGKALSKVVELCEGGLRPPFQIQYEEERHQYFMAPPGIVNPEVWISVPSVTQVNEQLLNFDGRRDPGTALQRGTLIHKACELIVLGVLDWSTVDASILPEVETFAAWWKESRFKPLLVESIVGSWRYRFAGRLDIFGIWKTGLALIDFKTGNEYPAYRFQTAGLEIALIETIGLSQYHKSIMLPIQRYCLYLKGDKARPVQHEDPRDRNVFLAAHTCSHTRRELYP